MPCPPGWTGGSGAPILADLDLGTYLRPVGGHGLLVGGTEPACDPLEWLDDADAGDRTDPRAVRRQHLRAARRSPDLRVPNRPGGVAGVYDVASDWTPVYDRTDRPVVRRDGHQRQPVQERPAGRRGLVA